jgi:sugar lactone lactonase YvrE
MMADQAVGEFAEVARGIYIEGLSVDHQREVVWYSDVIAGGIHGIKFDGTPVTSFNHGRMWTGGVLMNADGCVFSSGEGGIMWNDPESDRSGWLIDRLEGQPINGINEMVPDGAGGIFFGTNDIENVIAGKEARPSALYRLTAERVAIRLAEDFSFSNGISHDAAGKRFYCSDTFNCVWSFDVSDDLTLTNRRRFFEKQDADGQALDSEGNLWVTGFRSGYFERLASDGTVLPRVETPGGAITQLRFGGEDGCTYFLNSVPSDGGDSLKDGKPLTERNSIMYRGRSSVPGLKIAPARFKL